jgi:uncharacterized SAM-binding protein YcdF (DUF218 family)
MALTIARAAARRRLSAVFAIVAAVGIGMWVGREWLLLSAADLWIVSDPIGPADAVAVFGGGLHDRPFAAAQYYRQGLVKKILVSDTRQSPAETFGVSDVTAEEGVLLELGVPASAIETFGSALRNTHQEAVALQVWAEHNNARSIIVPTEIFSARRVRWMLHRAFGGGLSIRVIAIDSPQFGRDDWWRHTQGISVFRNELVKYIYYRLKY